MDDTKATLLAYSDMHEQYFLHLFAMLLVMVEDSKNSYCHCTHQLPRTGIIMTEPLKTYSVRVKFWSDHRYPASITAPTKKKPLNYGWRRT